MTNTHTDENIDEVSDLTPEEIAEMDIEATKLTREERMSCDNARLAMMAHEFDEEETFEDKYRDIKFDKELVRNALTSKISSAKRALWGKELQEVKRNEAQMRKEQNEERRGSEESDMIAIKKLCGLPLGYIFA